MFENEEDTPGWKEGKSVAYCETCFNETMKRRESREGQDDAFGILSTACPSGDWEY